MFQYTREFIINEDVVSKIANGIVQLEGIASYKTGVDEGGMNRIFSFNEVAHEAEVVPVSKVVYPTTAGKDKKLVLRVNLYRATDASYANNLEAKMSKLFQIEIPAGTTIADAVELITRTLKKSDYPFVKVSVDGTSIKVTGTNGYQQIKELDVFESTGIDVKHEQQWELSKTGTVVNLGNAGFGTYEKLIKDNRLPTMENTNYFSPNKYEMPWPGATYKLIEFTYNSGIRNIGGQGVVGSYERSMTKHRFWVNTKATLTEFNKAIAAIKPAAIPESAKA